MRRDVFQAIADPTRRAILGKLAAEPQNLNTLSSQFRVSRPAISKHVRILAECGLLEIRQQGRERFCKARPEKLREVSEWLEQYQVFWTHKLDALGRHLAASTHKTPTTQSRKPKSK